MLRADRQLPEDTITALPAAALIQGTALQIPLASETVDLIVTSPPFFGLRSYTDQGEHYAGQLGSEPTPAEFLAALWAATAEMKRVLKPGGSIFLNLGDKYSTAGTRQGNNGVPGDGRIAAGRHYASKPQGIPDKSLLLLPEAYRLGCTGMLAQLGGPDPGLNLIARSVTIWDKPNSLPESVRDRVPRSHEDWVHLTKKPSYYSATDELRQPHQVAIPGRRHSGAAFGIDNPLGKLPGSVWTIPTEPLRVPEYMIPASPTDMDPRWVITSKDAWWLLRHGIIPPASAWPRDDTRKELRAAPDHYAAFPSEWPRRLILGFSPPGICVGCGQGRVPIVDMQREPRRPSAHIASHAPPGQTMHGATGRLDFTPSASILGYACACTPHTDHPGAGKQDPEWGHGTTGNVQDNGRYAGSHLLAGLGGRPKVGGWREYHLTGWTPPPTRPAIILDPFAGTGTTVMVARALGRSGIGIDLSADYLRLARWRIYHSGHAAKAQARTWDDRQTTML